MKKDNFKNLACSAMTTGFTLAEVIITISILGVVAALTIGNFIPHYQERTRIVQLKDSYAKLIASYDYAFATEGPITEWGISSASSSKVDNKTGLVNFVSNSNDTDRITTLILSGLKYKDTSITGRKVYYMNWKDQSSSKIFNPSYDEDKAYTYKISKSGAIYSGVWVTRTNCNFSNGARNNICGEIAIDVNGNKGPNTVGVDMFKFWVTSNSVVPMGEKGSTVYGLNDYCNKDANKKQFNGYGCTAWALYNGNQDYLKRRVHW